VKHSPLFGIIMLSLVVTAGSMALAGDYHLSATGTLHCSDCHNMHGSLTHGQDGSATTTPAGLPAHELLKGADPNAMCLACHDGSTAGPDVLGANTGAGVRQAGALTTGTNPYEDWKGHTLGSTATAPGGTFAASAPHGLECITCHAQHGQTSGITWPVGYTLGSYRNLKNKPGGGASNTPVSYAIGTNDVTKDVFERDATLGQFDTHYSINNVDFNEPSTTASAYANWCKDCHTNFHGSVAGAEVGGDAATMWAFTRHPSSTVNVGRQSASGHSGVSRLTDATKTNYAKMMDPAGTWNYKSATSTTSEFTPSCFSCHKAHGNQNPYGLIYMRATGAVTEEGTADGVYDSMCKQCHVQGGTN
jgi:hypothetical protein